jgi:hypothetical protein
LDFLSRSPAERIIYKLDRGGPVYAENPILAYTAGESTKAGLYRPKRMR